MRRGALRKYTAVFLLPTLWPTLIMAQTPSAAGIVTTLKGQATVTRAARPQEPQPLNFKNEVFYKDRISTREKSLVRVLLGGKALVTVRELSDLTITEEPGRPSIVGLANGKLGLAVARALMSSGDVIQVRTPNAVAAVRGTVIVVEVIRPSGEGSPGHATAPPDYQPVRTAFRGETVPVQAPNVITNFHVLLGSIEIFSLDKPDAPPVTLSSGSSLSVTGSTIGEPHPSPVTGELILDLQSPPQHTSVSEEASQAVSVNQQATATTLARILTGEQPAPSEPATDPVLVDASSGLLTTDFPDITTTTFTSTTSTPITQNVYLPTTGTGVGDSSGAGGSGGGGGGGGTQQIVTIDLSNFSLNAPLGTVTSGPTTIVPTVQTFTGLTGTQGTLYAAVDGTDVPGPVSLPGGIGLTTSNVLGLGQTVFQVSGADATIAGSALALTNSSIDVGSTGTILSVGSSLTSPSVAPLVSLDASTITTNTLASVGNGGTLTITGNLASLTNNSTLNLVNGPLGMVSGGSVFTVTGSSLGSFGAGINTLSSTGAPLCSSGTCVPLLNSGFNILLTGGALDVNVLLDPSFTAFMGLGETNTVTGLDSTNALIVVDGATSQLVLGPSPLPTLVIPSGTRDFSTASAQNFSVISISGGTLTGSDTVTAFGPFFWSGGTMSGSGTTAVGTGSTMTVTGTPSLSQRTLSNAGTFLVETGSILSLDSGATLTGGTFTTSGTGVIRNTGTATLSNLTNAGAYEQNNATTTTLVGTLNNVGTFLVNSAGSTTDVRLSGDVTLTGGGTVTLSDNSNNRILGNAGTDRLTNADNLIQGAGQLGANGMALTNQGTILANATNALILDPTDGAGNAVNSGTLKATGGATLVLQNGTFTNTGLIQADAGSTVQLTSAAVTNTGATIEALTGALVQLNGVSLTGGTLTTSGTGVFRNVSTVTLDGVTKSGAYEQNNATTTTLVGTLNNVGTFLVNSAGSTTDVRLSGDVTLTGGGTVTLSDNSNNRILGNAGTDRLTNADNLIQGAGQLGANGMALTNQGTILANQTNTLTIDPSSSGFTNQGTLRANAGSTLKVTDSFTNFSGTTLTGGTYQVLGTMRLSNANIVTNAAAILLDGPSSSLLRDDTSANALANFVTNAAAGSFTIQNGRDFTTAGAFSNAGAVTIGTGSTFTVGGNNDYTQTAGSTTVNGTLSVTGATTVSGGSLTTSGSLANLGSVTLALPQNFLSLNTGGTLSSNTSATLLQFNGTTVTVGTVSPFSHLIQVNGLGSLLQLTGTGALLSATNTSITVNGSAFLEVENGATLTSNSASSLVGLSGGTVTLNAGVRGLRFQTTGAATTLSTMGGLFNVAGTTIDTTGSGEPFIGADLLGGSAFTVPGDLLNVSGGGALVANAAQPVASITGGSTHSIATGGTAALFNLSGSVSTDQPIHGTGACPSCPLQTKLLETSGATINTNQGVKLDTALLDAVAPLFNFLAGSTVTSGNPFVNLANNATTTATLVPSDALIKLNASTLTINSGSLVNVAGGSTLNLTGNLVSLAGGSTLNVLSGGLLNVLGGSTVTITGTLISFSAGNTVNVNNAVPFTGITNGITFSATGGATVTINNATPIVGAGATTGTAFSTGSLIIATGAGTSVTIN